MRTANAITNDIGAIRSIKDDVDMVSANGRRKDPWQVKFDHHEEGILSDLVHINAFNLLARHLLDTEGLDPFTVCLYAKSGITRSIQIGRKRYRSSGYAVYARV